MPVDVDACEGVMPSREIKVTIMIPTFNQAVFVGAAIDSALAQTYPNLEIIVGDDASTDATSKIVGKICDSRLKYVRNACNLGRSANYRNLLYAHAAGDYVVNLDGDDYYTDKNFIAEAVDLINSQENVVMIAARVTTKTANGEHVSDIPPSKDLTGIQILKKLPDLRYFVMHMAVLYARKPALEIGFYRSSAISSDWESLYRLSLLGGVKYLDKKVGVWRIHGLNETETTNPAKQLENLAIWPVIYKDAAASGMNSLQATFMAAKCIAFFAQTSCVRVSMSGNAVLLKFLGDIVRSHRAAALLLLLTPTYAARVLLGLMGYYRRKRAV
jgi:glycosyltransferase involved in cell wall biosynthesis